MNEKPIIFNGDMVRAVLAGRKTQTRRPLTPQPVLEDGLWRWETGAWSDGSNPIVLPGHGMHNCAAYHADDRLWIKETWALQTGDGPDEGTCYAIYRADKDEQPSGRWGSAIHMPRTVARTFLRVKSVRVERVQDITELDALAEGITAGTRGYPLTDHPGVHVRLFARLWDDIYAKQGRGWAANPWVWLIEFEPEVQA